LARKEVQALNIIPIPDELSVGSDFGLLVRDGAPQEAWRLAMYILSPDGPKILKEYGFEAAVIPK
jgi:ABC-type molybdate transport system substrate-binding protein